MLELSITKRKLKDSEIKLLITEFRDSPYIVGYTEAEWQRFGQIFVAEYRGEFAGICAELDLGSFWGELANLFVLKRFRGFGIGKALFMAVFDSLEKSGKNIYIVTRNSAVIKMVRENEMTIHRNFFILPLTVQWHILKVGLHFFRIGEFVRKSFKYLNFTQWVYGIKMNKPKT